VVEVAVSILHAVALSAGAAILVVAGLHDVAARTVPNRLALAVAAAGIVARVLDADLPMSLVAALAVFAAAALCWHRGWMGGGDVKLLGAVAILVPPQSALALVVDIALAGGILALTYLLLYATLPAPAASARRPQSFPARAWRAERWRIARRGPIPYASAIAVGALFCLLGE
jgi:prepilin peptidase CpaA